MGYLIQQLLAESAARFPDREAVAGRDGSATYRELDELSGRIAAVLAAEGVARGDRVGVWMNKSVPAVAALLGVLRAGAAYVPLDPNAPPARLASIARNAGLGVVVTSTKKAAGLGALQGEGAGLRKAVLTDGPREAATGLAVPAVGWPDVLEASPLAAEPASIETDLAYILYTSGSTGTPKGVMISHRNALTFIDWAAAEFGLDPGDRVSSHAPFHFDLSIFDLFASLKAGASVHLAPEEYSIFPRRLVAFIREKRISVWYSVPSILTHMILHGGMAGHEYPDLRLVLFAGEVFPVKYLRELMSILPRAQFANLYGPTETNVCTYYRVPSVPPEETRPVPIGRACANIECFALDDGGKPVEAPGREGELYVRGNCVAQGYWGDPEKTARGFVDNPLGAPFRERVYRTGDIVTLDESGDWRLVGRRDHMVKSRGYRIELGEIEAALYAHQGVKEAAVVAVPDELITSRLVAFVVPMTTEGLDRMELGRHLAGRVPPYMVPETVEFREALPKTSTGKIDRKALEAAKA